MISRRELIRRMSLGIAAVAVPVMVPASKPSDVQWVDIPGESEEIFPSDKLEPINVGCTRLTINGTEIGGVSNVSMQQQRSVEIDITSLGSRPIIGSPDTSTVDVQVAAMSGSEAFMHDLFFSAEKARIRIDMQDMAYEFDSHILDYNVSSSANELTMIDFSMAVIGEILII